MKIRPFDPDPTSDFLNVPNYLFDVIMPIVSPNAWKVLFLLVKETEVRSNKAIRLTLDNFARKTGISKSTVKTSLQQLEVAGYILILSDGISPEIAYEKIKSKTPQAISGYTAICDWCQCGTHRLQAHHYPIPAKDGGTKTVNICANCHAEYHYLVDQTAYALTPKALGE